MIIFIILQPGTFPYKEDLMSTNNMCLVLAVLLFIGCILAFKVNFIEHWGLWDQINTLLSFWKLDISSRLQMWYKLLYDSLWALERDRERERLHCRDKHSELKLTSSFQPCAVVQCIYARHWKYDHVKMKHLRNFDIECWLLLLLIHLQYMIYKDV